MKKVFLKITALLAAYMLAGTPVVFAATAPTFPSCLNPQGSVIANYGNGDHGIPGSTSTYTGSDTVYSLSGIDTVTQCFCGSNGAGIQTNWWKATQLSVSDIDSFRNQGWVYVGNGGLWGLSGDPYLALNSDYTCALGEGGGFEGQVLGLATTGDWSTIPFLTASGISVLLAGYYLLRKNSR